MAIKYVFAKNAEELEKIHAKAVKSVQSARVQVQIAAVATIRHAWEHGDWTYAQKLVDGLGNTINGSALVEWFKTYGGLKVGEEGFTGWSGKDYIEENFQSAKDKMWWELKVKNPFKGFDLEAALLKVVADHAKTVKAMEEMADDDKAKVKLVVNDATIQAVLKLCNFEGIFAAEQGDELQEAA
jgi:hypothetical protein